MALSPINQGIWLAALQALLPPGRAFSREPGSVLTKALGAIAALLLAAQLRFEDLICQRDPRLATSLLPEWERTLGLPDACTPAGQTRIDRQLAAYQRYTEQGGQSRTYFIDLANKLGEAGTTITEHRPMTCNGHCNDALYGAADRFVFLLNLPRAALNVRAMTCNSHCNSPLQQYTPSVIECVIKERKPAHTNVLFAYTA